MSKSNITPVTTEQIDKLVEEINRIYRTRVNMEEEKKPSWQEWRDNLVSRIHGVRNPSARPYSGRVVADILRDVLSTDLLRTLERLALLQDEKEWVIALERERDELRAQVDMLEKELRRRPQAVTATLPVKKATLRTPLQQEIVRLMGKEGLGRSWRIKANIVKNGLAQGRSVLNAMGTLRDQDVIDYYRRKGKPVSWRFKRGGGWLLLVLTELGEAWYREAFGQEPLESEISKVAKRHSSVTHGVGILEVKDHLRAVGYEVDDDPGAILVDERERWRNRSEPDLVAVWEGVRWSVEVQREVSERVLDKWSKALSLTGRLMLVLFNERKRKQQIEILKQAEQESDMPQGSIWVTSIEAMRTGEWDWTEVRFPFTDEWMNGRG